MKTNSLLIFVLSFTCSIFFTAQLAAADFFIEAESFSNKGGWVIDQQFSQQMGSYYLMAHGMGNTVADAYTTVEFPKVGTYKIFVRTYNWTSPWSNEQGPGKFQILINDKPINCVFGDEGNKWLWQDGGKIKINEKTTEIKLRDLTGFNGRCDAIYFTQDESFIPPSDISTLSIFRKKQLKIRSQKAGKFDLVVIGGGVAGVCTAVSASRLGLKVALIHDRPIYGGNNSSDVRVHLGGRIGMDPYPELGGIVKEISPLQGGNAMPASRYEDEKKAAVVDAESNITQFINYKAFAVTTQNRKIRSVKAKNTVTGKELIFYAPLFADCTGDGTIGFLAGADYLMGREASNKYNEPSGLIERDSITMGTSVQWYSEKKNQPVPFPVFQYGINFNENNVQKVTMGEWTWETGMNHNQITDFEQIRDYGLMVIFSNWSFLKNKYAKKQEYANLALGWVAYIGGKRESRRLLGDFILKEQDIVNQIIYPDASATSTWSIDLHYPDPENTQFFKNNEFKSIAIHKHIEPYPIPYRCFYSRNVENLFMAGRNISVTHIALGTVRVMRTTGMMGEVVGMAAAICKKHNAIPRDVYEKYLYELILAMKKGVGKEGTKNYPNYN